MQLQLDLVFLYWNKATGMVCDMQSKPEHMEDVKKEAAWPWIMWAHIYELLYILNICHGQSKPDSYIVHSKKVGK